MLTDSINIGWHPFKHLLSSLTVCFSTFVHSLYLCCVAEAGGIFIGLNILLRIYLKFKIFEAYIFFAFTLKIQSALNSELTQ